MVDSVLTVGGVAWTIGDKDSVEVVHDLVNGVVVREDCDANSSADQTAKDILFHTAVNNVVFCAKFLA